MDQLREGPSRVRIPLQTREFLFSETLHTGSEVHPVSYSLGPCVLYRGQIGRGVKLTTHFHLEQKLRISAAILSLPYMCS